MNNEIWESAEFVTGWESDGLRYKALSVPRESIDEDDDNQGALMVIGIDDGGVRRIDWLFDPCYSRMDGEHQNALINIMEHAPEEVTDLVEILGLVE